MIQVGINKNVYIIGASITEKGFLEIGFDQADNKRPSTAFEMLNQDGIVDMAPVFNMFLFYSATPKNEDGKLTKEKLVDRVSKDMKSTKEILTHILMGYMTTDDANLAKIQFENIDITADNFETKILNEEVQKKIFNNIASAFILKMKPFFGNKKLAFRLLLTRQGKEKHFASFRRNYINENPFWESMDVDDKASKLKFTDYEIKEGLTDATPVSRDTADQKKKSSTPSGGGDTTMHTAADVFGGG